MSGASELAPAGMSLCGLATRGASVRPAWATFTRSTMRWSIPSHMSAGRNKDRWWTYAASQRCSPLQAAAARELHCGVNRTTRA